MAEYSIAIKNSKKKLNNSEAIYVIQKDPSINNVFPIKLVLKFINSFNIEISTFSDTIIIAIFSDDVDIEDAFFIQLVGLILVPLFRFVF